MEFIKLNLSVILLVGLFHDFGSVKAENDSAQSRLRKLEKQLYDHINEEYLRGQLLGRRESFTLSTYKRRRDLNKELLADISKINAKQLTPDERIDFKILRHFVKTLVRGHKWILFGALNPINFLEGFHMSSLEHIPSEIYEKISLMRKAIRLGRTNYLSDTMREKLEDTINRQVLMLSFPENDSSLGYPLHYRDTSIMRQLKTAYEAFVELKSFFENEYIPASRKHPGIHSMRNGIGYYKACLRFHATTSISPDEAHIMGLDEVERIANEISKIQDIMGFSNTDLRTFIEHVYRHTAISSEQQLDLIKDVIKRVDPSVLGKLFYKSLVPPVRVQTRHNPTDLSLASYSGNVIFVNANPALNRSSILMPPLVLHEANPGHHFQESYVDLNLQPSYRLSSIPVGYHIVPFRYPIYTAFIEGWALYAEHLGEELGVYPTLYDKLGRYLSEMLRACRLAIDTGIHAFGWSKHRAIDFMRNYTGSDFLQAENEIEMMILWPGRSSAYKIGELKIKQLRVKAETALGSKFNIKDFHDATLHKGPVPLHILDEMIGIWIKQALRNGASNGIWMLSSNCFTMNMSLFILFLRF